MDANEFKDRMDEVLRAFVKEYKTISKKMPEEYPKLQVFRQWMDCFEMYVDVYKDRKENYLNAR